MMQELFIEDIRLHAFHGCLEEEARIGGKYRVDVKAVADFNLCADSDDLEKAVDYVLVYQLVSEEMRIRSKLIETVAKRISERLKGAYPWVSEWEVHLTKFNPPVQGSLGQSRVVWKLS
ncbi:MAG: dihydroneopterin aldolase [Flavobacteriales bacterium]|nr:dihydroneopterin aldolase [Flavobacteriales bacterium]